MGSPSSGRAVLLVCLWRGQVGRDVSLVVTLEGNGWKAHKFMLPEGEKVREGVPTRIPFAFSVQNVCSKHWLKRGYVIGGANVGLALLMTFRLNDRGVS